MLSPSFNPTSMKAFEVNSVVSEEEAAGACGVLNRQRCECKT